ncbi:hypothetical protein TARUN_6944 [Trichoderma arundinaceum]|uniref:Uncharacterized protein n=1 Tax=Trichoderma arundinaceum TaxID=490622 RepID=A0A395NHJ1_TRIAR|nr:hypothetical protein TARUN_6944 [Trichoderma arundinaceum]
MFRLSRGLRIPRSFATCGPASVPMLLFGESDGVPVAAEEDADAGDEGGEGEADDEADDEIGMGGRA